MGSASTTTTDLEPDQVVEELRRRIHTIDDAHRSPNDGGLPVKHGIYAWWMAPDAIADVTGPAHPSKNLELLYVGIAPKDARSEATLRSRIRGQHLGGNIGSSTFRQSLAALLFQDQGWLTSSSGSRTQLISEHNRALTDWQREHLRLAWVERPSPWTVEDRVIALMQPPLNLAHNASHDMHRRLTQLRATLREGTS